jgi:hypothetical protein
MYLVLSVLTAILFARYHAATFISSAFPAAVMSFMFLPDFHSEVSSANKNEFRVVLLGKLFMYVYREQYWSQ